MSDENELYCHLGAACACRTLDEAPTALPVQPEAQAVPAEGKTKPNGKSRQQSRSNVAANKASDAPASSSSSSSQSIPRSSGHVDKEALQVGAYFKACDMSTVGS
jgi:hypothetical protein